MARCLALAFFFLIACDARLLTARGEALLIVDTDVAVPSLVSRLRVDVYRDDGTWIDSRSIGPPSTEDWPASFSIYNPDDGVRVALVRVRVYPDGVERDYHGERYMSPPAPMPAEQVVPDPKTPGGEKPRWIVDGKDVTPSIEPSPFAAIDRLVRVRLASGVRGAVHLVLHGSCFGRMANLKDASTCVDDRTPWTTSIDAALDPDMRIPARVATPFGARTDCTAAVRTPRQDLLDDEVCVPGGAFLFGDADGFGLGEGNSDVPQRVAVLPPFRMDRYEVTVARWRDALASGFAGGIAEPNDGPLASTGIPEACTYSHSVMGREDLPVNCVSSDDARAFCEWSGGSLPTEAQWKWVAQAAERPIKTRYPWGDTAPDCLQVVYGRDVNPGPSHVCASLGTTVQGERVAKADVALGTGIVNLAGNVAEITSDAFHSFKARCWAFPNTIDPRCTDASSEKITTTSASYADEVASTLSRTRRGIYRDAFGAEVGFRCVRSVP